MRDPVYVTRPNLPPLEDIIPYLEEIWSNQVLTNGGPFHTRLEAELAAHLGVNYLSLFANGTLALVTALQALGIRGEVITTPYSFVATTHALAWNNITPVFVDIDPHTLNLDPACIEQAITPQTTAILPTHIYGNPCDTKAIQQIADMYGLKVVYDAAHAFGVEDDEGSVLRHGDMSILSFHATKVYTTFEGGAIVSPDEKSKERVDYLKNFGFVDEVRVVQSGINGKMNEFQAAVGLAQLPRIDGLIAQRENLDGAYRELLADINGLDLPPRSHARRYNYSYFPIFISRNYPVSRDSLYDRLREDQIYTRRYFYPLISELPMYRGLESARSDRLANAHRAANSVLCLPIYPGLDRGTLERICDICRHPG